jgi:hypothetical protein
MPFIRLTIADPQLSVHTQQSLAAEITRLVDHELRQTTPESAPAYSVTPRRCSYAAVRNPCS